LCERHHLYRGGRLGGLGCPEENIMEITVGPVQPTRSDGDPRRVAPAAKSGGGRDRRKRKRDRRKNVREGVIVSLSVREDRRRPGDRRRTTG